MIQPGIRHQSRALRCPFCHEEITPEATDWVPCGTCLGPQHRACWHESRRCAACHASGPGTREMSEDPESSRLIDQLVENLARQEPNRELLRLLDADERARAVSALDYVWAPLSLGLHPWIKGEEQLVRHLEQNRPALHAPRRPNSTTTREMRKERYRGAALDEVARGSRRRMAWALLTFAICLAVTIWGILAASLPLFAAGGSAWVAAIQVGLSRLRAAVKTHEINQLYLGLLDRGVWEEQARRTLEAHNEVWSSNGWRIGGGTFLACLIPTLLPFWLTHVFRLPLTLHELRESEVPELFPAPFVVERKTPARVNGGNGVARSA